MSERTYAPRSGGRIAEQRSDETRRRTGAVEPRRRPSTGTEGDARRAHRQPAQRTAARGTAARDAAARGGRTAPVHGTAALKLNTAVAEPLRVAEAVAAAPRLRVAPPAPISAPRAPFITAVIGLVIVGVIGILLINTKTNENSFEISRLQDSQAVLDIREQQLENQLAVYDSAGNLDAAAKRLGLIKADAPAYIRLPDGKVIGVPVPGRGQPAVTAQDADDQPADRDPGARTPAAQKPVAYDPAARNPAAQSTGTTRQQGPAAVSNTGQ